MEYESEFARQRAEWLQAVNDLPAAQGFLGYEMPSLVEVEGPPQERAIMPRRPVRARVAEISTDMLRFKGSAVSPGICIAQAIVVDQEPLPEIQETLIEDSSEAVASELNKFREVVGRVFQYYNNLGTSNPDHADKIAMALGLFDPELPGFQQVEEAIKQSKHNCVWATKRFFDHYISKMNSRYHGELSEAKERLLRELLGLPQLVTLESSRFEKACVVANVVTPVQTLKMHPSVVGMIEEEGGTISHTAIVARAKNIPAVTGVENLTTAVRSGDWVIIDGFNGMVVVRPDDFTLQHYKDKQALQDSDSDAVPISSGQPRTKDNQQIKIRGTMHNLDELDLLVQNRAEGIGLFRTEFLFFSGPVSEEDQTNVYTKAVKVMGGAVVTVRTMDFGGDKSMPWLRDLYGSGAPRIWTSEIVRNELFLPQLRAIVRAACEGSVRIMFPLINDLTDLDLAKKLVTRAFSEVEAQYMAKGKSFSPRIEIGAMVETPAAVLLSDQMIPYLDFIAIGTNDLTELTLSVPRDKSISGRQFTPHHPAVLRQIALAVKTANSAGKSVSVCGEMSSHATFTPLLLGLGVREFTMSAPCIPRVNGRLLRCDTEECSALASAAMACRDAEGVMAMLTEFHKAKLSET